MRLTRRGVAVLAAAIVLLVLGQIAGYPVLLALAAAALGALVAAAIVIHRSLRSRFRGGGAGSGAAWSGGRRPPCTCATPDPVIWLGLSPVTGSGRQRSGCG